MNRTPWLVSAAYGDDPLGDYDAPGAVLCAVTGYLATGSPVILSTRPNGGITYGVVISGVVVHSRDARH
jgi:hypothetical protein